MATTIVATFWDTMLTDLLGDVTADMLPDAQAVLAIVTTGGYQALLLPSNQVVLMSFLVRLQADGLAVGNDLSKQVAAFIGQFLTAKFAALTAAAVAPVSPLVLSTTT